MPKYNQLQVGGYFLIIILACLLAPLHTQATTLPTTQQQSEDSPQNAVPVRTNGQVIYLTGSTLMKDYTTAIIDHLKKYSNVPQPIIVNQGSTRGIKAFCSGIGLNTPDIVTMSRRILSSELDDCHANGVNDIIEIQIGYEANGIVSARSDQDYRLTTVSLYKAIAAELPSNKDDFVQNTYRKWHDVDPNLPNTEIRMLIPTLGLGGRTFLEDKMLQAACRKMPDINAISSASIRVKQCVALRADGRVVDLDIPYDLNVVRTLATSAPGTLAVLPLHSIIANQEALKLQPIDGIMPDHETVSNRSYKFIRPLYFLIKRDHIQDYWKNGLVFGLREFITEATRESTLGPDGYLVKLGVFPLEKGKRDQLRATSLRLDTLDR